MCFSVDHVSSAWCQYILFLLMLNMITWLKWCMLGFSTAKLLCFSLQLINISWGVTLRLCKYFLSSCIIHICLKMVFYFHDTFYNYSLEYDCKEELPSPPFIYVFNCCFISVWIYDYCVPWVFIYCSKYLLLFLKLSKIWPLGAPLSWPLCSFT